MGITSVPVPRWGSWLMTEADNQRGCTRSDLIEARMDRVYCPMTLGRKADRPEASPVEGREDEPDQRSPYQETGPGYRMEEPGVLGGQQNTSLEQNELLSGESCRPRSHR